jgi:hypothetical protein
LREAFNVKRTGVSIQLVSLQSRENFVSVSWGCQANVSIQLVSLQSREIFSILNLTFSNLSSRLVSIQLVSLQSREFRWQARFLSESVSIQLVSLQSREAN